MALRFFNTMTRTLEEFIPVRQGEASLYCCGPTVYNFVHIGNLRAYVFNDLLRRYLRFRGYRVRHVMNITDVDDKTIRGARTSGKALRDFTEFYSTAFLEDLKTLRIETPEVMPRATDEIPGMVQLIKRLLDKGCAYRSEQGDIYFRISSFEHYGELAHLDRAQLKTGASGRVLSADEYGKEDASDFALWKAHGPDDGDVFWDTEIGKGRPGWHIECSAMSERYLGQPFDIHCGGEDLVFPHHTNEIAQSECAHGKRFVNYWLHNAHLIVDGRKMSKSLGNYYTLRDLLQQGLDPGSIRYELLKTHYRQNLDFRIESVLQHRRVLEGFHDLWRQLHASGGGAGWSGCAAAIDTARASFTEAMDNDLNVSGGLAAIFELFSTVNSHIAELSKEDVAALEQLITAFDGVLDVLRPEQQEIDAESVELAAQRERARKEKNFTEADRLRAALLARGVTVKDTPQGQVLTKTGAASAT